MPIELNCRMCDKRLRVPDSAVDKLIRCPSCGTVQAPAGLPPDVGGWSSPDGDNSSSNPATPYDSREENPYGRATAGLYADPERSVNPYAAPATSDFPAARSTSPIPGIGRDAALSKVAGPAVAMLVVSILGLILIGVFGTIALIGAIADNNIEGVASNLISAGLSIPINIVILVGALKMLKLENYGLAIAAAILSIACNCACLSLPFGIWALVVLCDESVRREFIS